MLWIATFSDLTVMKTLDKSSPKLFLACASGEHIPEVELAGVTTLTPDRKDTRSADYYVITLKDVLVSSYQQSGASGDSMPVESISLNFAEIKVEYKPRNPDGTLGDSVTAEWNLKENTGA